MNAEELIKKTVALMESVGGHSLTAGNKVTLPIDGPATYEAFWSSMMPVSECSLPERSFPDENQIDWVKGGEALFLP